MWKVSVPYYTTSIVEILAPITHMALKSPRMVTKLTRDSPLKSV
jgi:hypothetical protein